MRLVKSTQIRPFAPSLGKLGKSSKKRNKICENMMGCHSKWAAFVRICAPVTTATLAVLVASSPLTILPALAQGGVAIAECAACHGEDGIGKDVEIPNLAGQHEVYLYRQLQHFKSGKRSHKEMRFESRQLSDADMQALAHYYSQLPR
ncbi:c-type cytochrome [Methylocystis echinoides]|nr:cytochrome c [Methylocystis echinoides]